ncbi:MAG: hypothetical protein ACI3W9_04510 [Eubacteriales bacterium]
MAKVTKTFAKTRTGGVGKAIAGGIVTICGIFFLIYPIATPDTFIDGGVSILTGALLTVLGFAVMVSGLSDKFARLYAVVFTEEGIYDFTGSHKNGLFIEWNNIKDARIYGRADTAFVGIDLISLDIAYKNLSRRYRREISENISNGMPAVMIYQIDVAEPIGGIVKAILQIRLGTKSELFTAAEAVEVTGKGAAPSFSAVELESLRMTGEVDIGSAPKATHDRTRTFADTAESKAIPADEGKAHSGADCFQKSEDEPAAEESQNPVKPVSDTAKEEKVPEWVEKIMFTEIGADGTKAEAKKAEPKANPEPVYTVKHEKTAASGREKEDPEKAADRIEESADIGSIDDLLSMLSIGDDK